MAFLVALIWAEISVFALVGGEVGALVTIIGVFVTAALGLRLFRKAGMATMRRLQEAAASGRPPVLELADGGAIILAAGLLLIPGFVTDAAGFVLFVPGLRTVLALFLLGFLFRLMPRSGVFMRGGFQRSGMNPEGSGEDAEPVPNRDTPGGAIIDGEFERKD